MRLCRLVVQRLLMSFPKPKHLKMEKILPDTDADSSREAPTTPTDISSWKRLCALECEAWTPSWCRQGSNKEFGCPTSFIILCTCANTISAANLYYTHPVLNKAADDFGVNYEHASLIPRLLQGGYGISILLLCPLVLVLTSAAAAAWLGLCLAPSFEAFTALGLQGLLVSSIFLFFPDLPLQARNDPSSRLRKYVRTLSTVLRLAVTRLVLALGCVVTFLANAALASF